MRGFKRLKWRFGATKPAWIMAEPLRIPARPAQPSRWPMTVLTDPTYRGVPEPATYWPKHWWIAAASFGSPAWVPVPCASKNYVCIMVSSLALHDLHDTGTHASATVYTAHWSVHSPAVGPEGRFRGLTRLLRTFGGWAMFELPCWVQSARLRSHPD